MIRDCSRTPHGDSRSLSKEQMGYCPICNHHPIAPSCETCPQCGNRDWVIPTGKAAPCEVCNGTRINPNGCEACTGSGRVTRGAVWTGVAGSPFNSPGTEVRCEYCNGSGKYGRCYNCTNRWATHDSTTMRKEFRLCARIRRNRQLAET